MGKHFYFLSPKHPEIFWGSLSLLQNGHHSLFPRLKRPGREAEHQIPISAEFKNECSFTFNPPIYTFMTNTGKVLPFYHYIKFVSTLNCLSIINPTLRQSISKRSSTERHISVETLLLTKGQIQILNIFSDTEPPDKFSRFSLVPVGKYPACT